MKPVLYIGCPSAERADTEQLLASADLSVVWADNSAGAHATAITNLTHDKSAGANHDNVYESNTITSTLKVVFRAPSQKGQNCFHNNRDEKGGPKKDLPDNRQGPCPSESNR